MIHRQQQQEEEEEEEDSESSGKEEDPSLETLGAVIRHEQLQRDLESCEESGQRQQASRGSRHRIRQSAYFSDEEEQEDDP